MSVALRRILLAACLLILAGARAVAAPAGARKGDKAAPVAIISAGDLKRALKKQKGRVVVLHFWATWCLPCLDELPLLSRIAGEAKARGIQLVSVSLDDPTARAAEKVGRVLDQRGQGLDRTIVRVDDPDAFVESIDPRWQGEIPAFFLYDREGRLKRAHVGEMTQEHFDKLVADLAPAGG